MQFSINRFIYWLVSFIYLFACLFDCLFTFSALPSSVCLWMSLQFLLRCNWLLHIPCVFCPSQVTKPSAQIGFIRFVLIPLFEALEQLFPVLEVPNTHLYKFFSTAIQLPTKSVLNYIPAIIHITCKSPWSFSLNTPIRWYYPSKPSGALKCFYARLSFKSLSLPGFEMRTIC